MWKWPFRHLGFNSVMTTTSLLCSILVDLNVESWWLFMQDMITAGMDTTAISVEWAIAELVRNPDVQAKAQQELDQVSQQLKPRN